MALIREQSVDRAHTRILENLLISTAFLESMAATLNASGPTHMKPQAVEVLRHLNRAYSGVRVRYQDYEACASAIQKMALTIWNPMMEGCTKDVSSVANSLFRIGWQIDNEPEEFLKKGADIPDLFIRLRAARDQLANVNELELKPFSKLTYEGELRAVGEALDAAAALPSQQSQALSSEDRSLAKLNIEFVSVQALRAWISALAYRGALPPTPSPILDALEDIEKFKHARPETKSKLTDLWMTSHPEMDQRYVQATVNALLGSACSTKLDTIYKSSVDLVSEIVRDVYEEQAIRGQSQKLAERGETPVMAELQQALINLQSQLDKLNTSVPSESVPALLNHLQQVSADLEEKIGQLSGGEDETLDDGPAQ